jgi:hypothetical protein
VRGNLVQGPHQVEGDGPARLQLAGRAKAPELPVPLGGDVGEDAQDPVDALAPRVPEGARVDGHPGDHTGRVAVSPDGMLRLLGAYRRAERIGRALARGAILVQQIQPGAGQPLADLDPPVRVEQARRARVDRHESAVWIEDDEPLVERLGERAKQLLGRRARIVRVARSGFQASAQQVERRLLQLVPGRAG